MAYRKFQSNQRGFGEKPVKEGETYDVVIEGIGSKGDGIGKIQGFVLIIPGVNKGDNVKVKVTAVRGKVAFGEVVGKGEAKAESSSEESEDASESEDSESSEEESSEDSESSDEVSESEEEPMEESEDFEEE